MTALAEVGDVLDMHTDLERRRGYDEPTNCEGRMVVVARDDVLWEIECDVCRFAGAVPARQVDPSLLPRLQALRVARRREQSGIPSELQLVTWEHVADNHPDVLAAARRIAGAVDPVPDDRAQGPRAPDWQQLGTAPGPMTHVRGLLLTGPVGVGKTWIAAATAWAILEHRPLRWLDAVSLLQQLDRDFRDEARVEAVDLIAGTEALVLDDLDKANGTDRGAAPLFDAINKRITAGAPLIVTANLDLDAIASRFGRFGDAIASRLAQHCDAFTLDGADRRLERFAA